jgi:DNA-binding NarL/FixJ family response regulator
VLEKRARARGSGRSGAGASHRVRVVVMDSHPLLVQALRALIASQDDLEFVETASVLEEIEAEAARGRADVALVGFDLWPAEDPRLPSVRVHELAGSCRLILLYDRIDPHRAWQSLHAGVAAIISRAAPVDDFVRAIRVVAPGGTYLDPTVQTDLASLARHEDDPATIVLTRREQLVLQLSADGLTTNEIAEHVRLSASSVKALLHEVYRKLDVRDRPQAVAHALRRGLIA